jgi:hypothetical protein
MIYVAVAVLGFTEREAWRKTPYQIAKLHDEHLMYHGQAAAQRGAGAGGFERDDIDVALGGF